MVDYMYICDCMSEGVVMTCTHAFVCAELVCDGLAALVCAVLPALHSLVCGVRWSALVCATALAHVLWLQHWRTRLATALVLPLQLRHWCTLYAAIALAHRHFYPV